jgi:putative transposase
MTQRGDPYENAVAERVTGMLKDELGLGGTLLNFPQADKLFQRAVRACNELRPPSSCGFLTPSHAH